MLSNNGNTEQAINPKELWFPYGDFDATRLVPKNYEQKTVKRGNEDQQQQMTQQMPQQMTNYRGRGGARGGRGGYGQQQQKAKDLNYMEQNLGYRHTRSQVVNGQTVTRDYHGNIHFRMMEKFHYNGIKMEVQQNGDVIPVSAYWLEINNPEDCKIINMGEILQTHALQVIEKNSAALRPGFKASESGWASQVMKLILNPDEIPEDKKDPKYRGQTEKATGRRLKAKIMQDGYWRGTTFVMSPSGKPVNWQTLIGRPYKSMDFVCISHLYVPTGANAISWQVYTTGIVITGFGADRITSNFMLSTIQDMTRDNPELGKIVDEELAKPPEKKTQEEDDGTGDGYNQANQVPQITQQQMPDLSMVNNAIANATQKKVNGNPMAGARVPENPMLAALQQQLNASGANNFNPEQIAAMMSRMAIQMPQQVQQMPQQVQQMPQQVQQMPQQVQQMPQQVQQVQQMPQQVQQMPQQMPFHLPQQAGNIPTPGGTNQQPQLQLPPQLQIPQQPQQVAPSAAPQPQLQLPPQLQIPQQPQQVAPSAAPQPSFQIPQQPQGSALPFTLPPQLPTQ